MMSWIRDAWRIARRARKLRKAGLDEELVLVPMSVTEGYIRLMDSYQHAYDCIEAMVQGKSVCRYCMEREHCHSKKRGNLRGCGEWVLSFPEHDDTNDTEAENEQAAAEENRAAEQENHQAPVQGDDAGTADGRPGEERDHGGGSETGMA